MIDFETHKKFGNSIKEFRLKLMDEAAAEKSYKKTPEQKALDLLEKMRTILDDVACRDLKEKTDQEVTNIYYGETE